MALKISPPILGLKPSVTLGIDEKVRKIRDTGSTVYHFGFGSSPFPAPQTVIEYVKKNADKNRYYSTLGVLELREAIARFYEKKYRVKTDPDQLIIAPGSKAIFFLLSFVIDGPLLLPKPSWVSHEPQAKILGKQVFKVDTLLKDDLFVTAESLESTLKKYGLDNKKQKLLLINYPNNPTSDTYKKKVLEDLAEKCREYNIYVISDEIYGLLTFDGEHHSFSNILPEKTFMTTSLSKDRSLGGYRLGVLRVPEAEKQSIQRFKALASEIWSCIPGPIQYGSIAAFQDNEDINEHITMSKKVYQTVEEYAYKLLTQETDLLIPKPKGAYYMFPLFQNYAEELKSIKIKNSEQLSHYLLDKYHVATLPSTPFGMNKRDLFLRLALVDFDGEKVMKEWKQFNEKTLPDYAPRVVQGLEKIIQFLKDIRQ